MTLKENFDGGLTCSLNVIDIQASMKWYQNIFGFELLYFMEELGWCELKSSVAKVNLGFPR